MDLLTASGMGGNQYLRPEYLTPLPTTLDAKKSPLALLAQTCSQIGADPPATKSLLASITSSSNSNGSSSRTSESSSDPERSASSSSATSGPGGGSKTVQTTPGGNTDKKKKDGHSNKKGKPCRDRVTPPTNVEKVKSVLSPSKISPRSRSNSREDEQSSVAHPPVSKTTSKRLRSRSPPTPETLQSGGGPPPEKRAATTTPPLPKNSSSSTNSNTLLGSSGKGDKLNLNGPSFPPSLFPPFPPTTIPPYLHSYARLKAAASAEQSSLYNAMCSHNPSSGLCRDPYCTGCSSLGAAGHHLSSLAASSSKCPAGCSSCDHLQPHPSASSKAATAHLSSFFPPLHPHSSSALSSAALASFYHSQAAVLQGLTSSPYICNWIADRDSYCGKRFSSSEELLQHLRSHTSHSSLGLSLNLNSDGGLLDRYSRTYPTPPLSPLTSSSSSASSRYHPHPYSGKAPSVSPYNPLPFSPFGPHGLSPGLGMSHPSFSALAAAAAAAAGNSPYFPYSLYGHRLGSSSNGGHQ